MTSTPEGFKPVSVASEFIAANGPLWMSTTGPLRGGFRVEARHTNVARTCHGSMIATFCDMLLTLTARAQSDTLENSFMSAIGLQVNYIAPARLGAWIEGEAQVLRSTGRMLFMQALVRADETLIARSSGILKAGWPLHDSGFSGETAERLHAEVPRVACSACAKTSQIDVPWAREGSGVTALVEALALSLCPGLPVRQAAALLRCSDKQLWRRIAHYVSQARALDDMFQVGIVGIDETSLRKGQNYITVAHDLDVKRLLYACEGRDHQTVVDFADDLKAHGGEPAQIQHVWSCPVSTDTVSLLTKHLQ